MQLVVSGNRILAHGEGFLAMGGTVINTETGAVYQNSTVVECDGCPSDLDTVGYEYHAGQFVPCAPFGKGRGNLAILCDGDCKSIKDSGWHMTDLLSGKTATKYGLGTDAVPNDVFDFLGKYSQHWWSVRHGQAKIGYEETRKVITSDVTVFQSLYAGSNAARSIYYSKEISVDQANGTVALVNPVEIALANDLDRAGAIEVVSLLVGLSPVYLTNVKENESGIYYIPEGATSGTYVEDCTLAYGRTSSDGIIKLRAASTAPIASVVTSVLYNVPAGGVTYEQSSDRNAYPDNGTVGNETYQYLGIPFDKTTTALRVENVTYTGAGVYGKSNYNSLTFSFRPLLVIALASISSKGVITNKLDGMDDAAIPFLATTEFAEDRGFGGGSGRLSADGKTFEWYSDTAANQLNTEGTTYHVMAIGLG